jgi:hypothetical protein
MRRSLFVRRSRGGGLSQQFDDGVVADRAKCFECCDADFGGATVHKFCNFRRGGWIVSLRKAAD